MKMQTARLWDERPSNLGILPRRRTTDNVAIKRHAAERRKKERAGSDREAYTSGSLGDGAGKTPAKFTPYGSRVLTFLFIEQRHFRSRHFSPRQESVSMFRTHSLTVVCTVAILFGVQPVYASHHFADYPVRPAGEYANKVAKAGLIVAVEPVEDPDHQKTYFDSRLNSKGILPVFVVIQNTSATDTYLFDSSAVGLADAPEVTGKGARKTVSKLGSGGLVDLTLVNDVSDVRENLMKKLLRSKTLAPGSSVHGFVYVPVPTDAARKQIHLQVPLTNSQSGESEVVNLSF
jgi:hypothetical protein